ncbi:MAG TPA: hypothetical protein VFU37_17305 [Pyrinomonadaceae bacterium]|nr:hypothetical protein [Pyrinomonadaceae bacterium]
MITFEIKLNGRSLGTAGAEDLSVLTAIVSAVGKLGPTSQEAYQREQNHHIELRVGGLTSRAGGVPDEHLNWSEQTLQPGDIVTISVVDATSANAPTASQPARTDGDFKQQYEWAKNFYLENRDKFDDG